jgi:ribosomal protein S27AE
MRTSVDYPEGCIHRVIDPMTETYVRCRCPKHINMSPLEPTTENCPNCGHPVLAHDDRLGCNRFEFDRVGLIKFCRCRATKASEGTKPAPMGPIVSER